MAGSPNEKGLHLASSLYKEYLIVGSSEYDHATGEWRPTVLIFPKHDGSKLYTIKHPAKRFKTETEAENFALDAGKAWVDAQSAKEP
jgi:hypothetical protein